MEHGVHTLVNYPSNLYITQCVCWSASINIIVDGWDILEDEVVLPILGKHYIVDCICYTSIMSLIFEDPTLVVGIEDVSDISVSGHAILVIGYGYDDGVLCYIVKNCLGVHWSFAAYMKFRPNVFH
ncbi:hypothetical protein AABB24_020385 [Solanum stoloniferum]|uniref:Peptidase C1A papain C-terminal domain-containing protein n=1 Tax=Solanum stoloniferum TaxID=62892 RepID=A0ABD2T8M4_9SOLN